MTFKDWISNYGELFWEVKNILQMDTSNVHWEPIDSTDDFDEDEAERECEHDTDYNWSWDDDDEWTVYDDPQDDPDFEAESLESWLEDNPEPEEDDYTPEMEEPNEENFSDPTAYEIAKQQYEAEIEKAKEKFDHDHEEWEDKKSEIESDYYSAVDDWNDEMRRRRRGRDEAESEARWEAVRACIEEKRSEHEAKDVKNGGYVSNFSVDTPNGTEKFKVEIERNKEQEYQGVEVSNTFNITFIGPKSCSSTGTAGNCATTVYTHLLLAVKKLLETEEVNGLTFTPAEPAMGLVYQRFYKQFLQKDFLRVEYGIYLKKTFLRSLLAKNPRLQKNAYEKIIGTNRDVLKKAKEVQANKAVERNYRVKLPKLVGRLVMLNQQHLSSYWNSNIVFVLQAKPTELLVATKQYDTIYTHNINRPNVILGMQEFLAGTSDVQTPDPMQAKQFIQDLVNWPYASGYPQIAILAKQYGITPTPQVQPSEQ